MTNSQMQPINLFDYRRTEINVLSDLQRLRTIAERVELETDLIELIDKALARNKEQKFSIAVVGEFKRGKSTFINALLGKDVLPSDILPCSATLNRVTYGLQPRVEILFKPENENEEPRLEEIEVEALAEYVTKLTPEAAERAAQIQEAIVHYPLPYLRNNVDIIDTPGLNDDQAMTDVTLSVLPQTSAAILVIMATAPFANSEADFLNNQLLLNDLGRIIFVVTAIDQMRREKDKQRILETIKQRIETAVHQRLAKQFGEESPEYKMYREQIGDPKVFGISGYDALIAKEENDDELLEESGFPKFESSLERFLTETRGAVELQTLANRIISTSAQIIQKLKMELSALQMSQKEFDEKYKKSMAELDELLQRRDVELSEIDQAAQRTRKRLRPFIDELPDAMKQAAIEVVEAEPMEPSDINSETFQEALNRKVSDAIRNATKRIGERLELEMERDLRDEVDRLGTFIDQVGQVLTQIEMSFSKLEDSKEGTSTTEAAIVGGADVLLGGTGLGGAYMGYREAGGRGAAVGGVAGFGAAVGVGAVMIALGVTALFPLFLAMGVASAFTGKWAVLAAFKQERVKRFKEATREHLLQEIDNYVKTQRLDVELNKQINNVYEALKERLMGEIDAAMNQTRATLDQLRSQKARQETLAEHKGEEARQLLDEVKTIRGRAQGLSSQLVKIDTV
ncbi:MAG: hypothetical protein DHS20C20_06390 [Ardenticatenaceae bacterium]|nr:MAG: hypothetical protein DHS20C20_06390 [Ardenticatenaceae bacterium]